MPEADRTLANSGIARPGAGIRPAAGPVSAGHQDRKAAGVRMLYRGQVEDQVAGAAEQVEELVTQGGS